MSEPDGAGLDRLRGVARWLLWGALFSLLLPLLAWLAAALYEDLAPPTDMHLPGLLTALLVFYLTPVGLVLLVLALAAGAWAWWLGRQANGAARPAPRP